MAIPGLIRPVEIDGRVMVDGGAVNPLPVDHLPADADIVVAIDVTGGPTRRKRTDLPGPWDAMFGTLQILQAAIVEEKIARRPAGHSRPAEGRSLQGARFLPGQRHLAPGAAGQGRSQAQACVATWTRHERAVASPRSIRSPSVRTGISDIASSTAALCARLIGHGSDSGQALAYFRRRCWTLRARRRRQDRQGRGCRDCGELPPHKPRSEAAARCRDGDGKRRSSP